MANLSAVHIPAFEFHFNLVVYPLPAEEKNVSILRKSCSSFKVLSQGQSNFYLLKNNAVKPTATGGTHWLEHLPDHVYCFVPSFDMDKGQVVVYDHIPQWLTEFKYSMEIIEVNTYF